MWECDTKRSENYYRLNVHCQNVTCSRNVVLMLRAMLEIGAARMNESWHVWMSHVAYERVTAHMSMLKVLLGMRALRMWCINRPSAMPLHVPWPIDIDSFTCDMTHSHVPGTHLCVTWLIHMFHDSMCSANAASTARARRTSGCSSESWFTTRGIRFPDCFQHRHLRRQSPG